MQKIFNCLAIAVYLWVPSALAATPQSFISDSQEVGKKYQAFVKSSEATQLLKDGKRSEVNDRLKKLVPDKDKTALDYFIVANMLYRADIPVSDAYIKKADELSPNNPFILFERAMHEHRAGNCQAALRLYETSSALFKETQVPAILWGYVTHCRLVLGDYPGAANAWRKVDFKRNHTSIEKSMYEIFSKKDPESEREQLINSISSGSLNVACELIKLDKSWEIDWWNAKENEEYLAHDTELLQHFAKSNAKISSALGLCVDAASMNDGEFRKYITAAGYWSDKYHLPADSAATYFLVSQLQKRQIATPQEMLQHYESQLLARHQTNPTDQQTLDVLAFLYSATNQSDKLKGIDVYGWKKLKLQNYAESYIERMKYTDSEYQPTVEQAAKDFPNSVRIQKANLMLHSQLADRPNYLLKYVAAQFSEVRNHLLGPYRLNDYMASLEYEINKPK